MLRNANTGTTGGMWFSTCLQARRSGKPVLGNASYPAEGSHAALLGHPGNNSDKTPVNTKSDHCKHTDKNTLSKMFPEEGVARERDVAMLAATAAVCGRCRNRDSGISQLLITRSRCKTCAWAVYTSSDETSLYSCRLCGWQRARSAITRAFPSWEHGKCSAPGML